MSEKNQKFIPLTLGVLAMSVLIGYLVFAWIEPSQVPPQGNVPAPLNVSDTPQTKTGSLRLGGLRTDSHTWLATESGNVGIGTTTPAYKLDVFGKINANEFCISGDCRKSWLEVGGEYVGFGDGSDGDVTITSETTLTRDMYYNNLTIAQGAILNPNGYRIFVKNTLINNGVLRRNGNPGEDGDGKLGNYAQGGAPLSSGTLFGSAGGGKGGYVIRYLTRDTSGGETYGAEKGESVVGIGNKGGRGGKGAESSLSPGEGGGVTKDDFYLTKTFRVDTDIDFTEKNLSEISRIIGYSLTNRELFRGGGGGGGGSPSTHVPHPVCIDTSGYYRCINSSNGGGGGSAGGIIYIVANKIINNGIIEAKGGNGGKGGRSALNSSNGDQVCGGGGGGGGAGGIVILIYNSYEGSGNIDVSGGIGGDPGPSGPCTQPPEKGEDGQPGKIIKIRVP